MARRSDDSYLHALDDAGLAAALELRASRSPEGLLISCGQLSPDGLAPLARVPDLQWLTIDARPSFAVGGNRQPLFTSRELGYLYPLKKLHTLRLKGGVLKPHSVVKLVRRLPGLHTLELTGCFPLETSLEPLLGLTQVRSLRIHGPSEYGEFPCFLDDDGLSVLSRMVGLEVLDLWRCKRITDAGVACLGALPRLQGLSVGDPDHEYSPGETALRAILTFPVLQRLSLNVCGRTVPAELWPLLRALPLEDLRVEACHLDPSVAQLLERPRPRGGR